MGASVELARDPLPSPVHRLRHDLGTTGRRLFAALTLARTVSHMQTDHHPSSSAGRLARLAAFDARTGERLNFSSALDAVMGGKPPARFRIAVEPTDTREPSPSCQTKTMSTDTEFRGTDGGSLQDRSVGLTLHSTDNNSTTESPR